MVQWLSLCTPSAGDTGLIPGQGTKFHMLQLRVHMLQLKILHAATKNPACCKEDQRSSVSRLRPGTAKEKCFINCEQITNIKKETERADYGKTASTELVGIRL